MSSTIQFVNVSSIGSDSQTMGTYDLVTGQYNTAPFVTAAYKPYREESPEAQALWKYLRTVFPGEGEAEKNMRILAEALVPSGDHSLIVFYGEGCNGKTVFRTFLKRALGGYYNMTELTTNTEHSIFL